MAAEHKRIINNSLFILSLSSALVILCSVHFWRMLSALLLPSSLPSPHSLHPLAFPRYLVLSSSPACYHSPMHTARWLNDCGLFFFTFIHLVRQYISLVLFLVLFLFSKACLCALYLVDVIVAAFTYRLIIIKCVLLTGYRVFRSCLSRCFLANQFRFLPKRHTENMHAKTT